MHCIRTIHIDHDPSASLNIAYKMDRPWQSIDYTTQPKMSGRDIFSYTGEELNEMEWEDHLNILQQQMDVCLQQIHEEEEEEAAKAEAAKKEAEAKKKKEEDDKDNLPNRVAAAAQIKNCLYNFFLFYFFKIKISFLQSCLSINQ